MSLIGELPASPGSDDGLSTPEGTIDEMEFVKRQTARFSEENSPAAKPKKARAKVAPEATAAAAPPEDAPEAEADSSADDAEPEDAETAPDEEAVEDEEGQADEESADASAEQPEFYSVMVDGAEQRVTLEELAKGYSRQQDYTRKTQKLAEERKAFEPEFVAVKAERQEYAAKLAALADALQSLGPQEPDWEVIRVERPGEYPQLWADHQRSLQQRQMIEGERQRALARVQQDQAEAQRARVAAEGARLLEDFPTWRDEKVRTAAQAELRAAALDLEFTDEDIGQVADRRLVRLLWKAAQYDKAQKARPRIERSIEKVKAATPGPAGAMKRQKPSEVDQARARLKQTGSDDDAVELFKKYNFGA